MEESQEGGLAVASRQRQKAKQSNVSRVQYPKLTLGEVIKVTKGGGSGGRQSPKPGPGAERRCLGGRR